MKTTDHFKEVIKDHLTSKAQADEQFKAKFESPKKNIDDCIKYILNTVQKSGCNGFTDAEVFGMASHYYDEEKIDVGKDISASVVVNHVDNTDNGKAYKINKDEVYFVSQKLKEEPDSEGWKKDLNDLRNSPQKYWDAFSLESLTGEKERYDEIKFMQDFYKVKAEVKKIEKPKAVEKPKPEIKKLDQDKAIMQVIKPTLVKLPPVKIDKHGQASLF